MTKARLEGEEKVRKAEEQVREELEKAERAWEKELERRIALVDAKLKEEEREKMSWARLEERRMLAEAREEILNEAMEMFKDQVAKFTERKEYAKWLEKVVEKGLEEMKPLKCVVLVKKGDKKKIKIKGVKVKEGAEILGGAIIGSEDGSVKLDLSLDAFIRQREDEIRRELYKHIFS